MSYFLAGDIGGTKTLLQVFKVGQERSPVLCKSYASADYASLDEIVHVFLLEAGKHEITCACFALAGTVAGRKVKLTNLPWEVDADALASHFCIEHVSLVNDFEAVGFGIATLQGSDILPLQQGEAKAQGVRIVVGAGTGLGVALLTCTAPLPNPTHEPQAGNEFLLPSPSGRGAGGEGEGELADKFVAAQRFHPHPSPLPEGEGTSPLRFTDSIRANKERQRALPGAGTQVSCVQAGEGTNESLRDFDIKHSYSVHPSEGGHMDFAPTNELQYALLKYLQQRHGHVSYERIVSGPGLVAIYEFLRDGQYAIPTPELVAAMKQGDAAAAIARFALEQQEEIALRAVEMFTQIYGAFVGNIALLALPRGGIYIAGGIAAKISAQMQQGGFMDAYLDKGRFKGLLLSLPVSIVMNNQVGLLGASLLAQRLRK